MRWCRQLPRLLYLVHFNILTPNYCIHNSTIKTRRISNCILQVCLEYGMSPHVSTRDWSLIGHTIHDRNISAFRTLAEYSRPFDLLHHIYRAMLPGCEKILKIFLSQVQPVLDLNYHDTALKFALSNGSAKTLKILLRAGVRIPH